MSTADDRLTAARARLAGVRFQAQRVVDTAIYPSQSSGPYSTITDFAASELGGAVSQRLFGLKRPGQSVVRSIARKNRENERQRLLTSAKQQAQAVLAQVEMEVRSLEGAVKASDRQRLLRSITAARSSVRPQTMASRCLHVIDLLDVMAPVSTESIQRRGTNAKTTSDNALSVLRSFEQELREFIAGRLSAQSSNWWVDLVPQVIRDQAEHRQKQGKKQWPWTVSEVTDPIHYVDFKDYSKIITDDRNWKTAFAEVFGDMDFVKIKLRELEPIRVEISHSRPVPQRDQVKLSLYATELSELMRRRPGS